MPSVCVNLQDYFNDIHNHLIRINKSIESLRDTISTSVQVSLALATIEKSEITKTCWLGCNFCGVYNGNRNLGMNFEYMPELKFKYGYPLILVFIFLVAFLFIENLKNLAGYNLVIITNTHVLVKLF